MNAATKAQAARFHLRPTAKRQSQLEWQFGQEEEVLFQLQMSDNAPTAGLIVERPNRTRKSLPVARRPDIEQWRRPSATAATAVSPARESVTPISQLSALEGEIVHSSAAPSPDGSLTSTPTWATPSPNGYSGAAGRRSPVASRSSLVAAFEGEEGMRRVLATRLALDEALDRWWTHSEHAPLALLRDGLLVLEAGHELDEAQRSFLLRTALRTERGMVTALRYQIDTDRTAFLFKEALLDTKRPFNPALIAELRRADEQSAEWIDYLEHDLAYEANVATGKRSQLAVAALRTIQEPAAAASAKVDAVASPVLSHLPTFLAAVPQPLWRMRSASQPSEPLRPLSHRWSLRWLFWAALMLFWLLSYGRPQLGSSAPLVTIPAGNYIVSDPASSNPATSGRFRTVTLAPYAIERHEVTNAAYRRCWEQNGCPIPSSFDSQSRPGYFANRAFDTFPVVHVNWAAANAYCAWMGRRLPTLEEWEVAASLAPATGLRYTYPWGDRFALRVVNSGLSNLNDTQFVGAYHPAGSTPLGIMDLAGNVAEWTAMPAASLLDGGVVKGGSFRDPPEQLRNAALVELPRDTSVAWLGFRCAVDK